jgi:dTDP-4-dehydrorhamnose reductase
MIAESTVQIAAQLLSPFCKGCKEDLGRLSGLYHLTCGGQTSWYDFARAVVERMEICPQVVPITTEEYPTPVQRPTYSVLSNQKLNQTFGTRLPDWDSALELCLLSKS